MRRYYMSAYKEGVYNGYEIRKMDYFTYEQFMNELDELKKDYYIIGYFVDPQEETARVKLVKREEAEHE